METGLFSSQLNVAKTLDMPRSKQVSNTLAYLHVVHQQKPIRKQQQNSFSSTHFLRRKKTNQKKACTPNGCRGVKGELNPEMKLCELLVLGHCNHLPLILFACASSGQSSNIGSPMPPNFCDVIDTAMTGDPIAFWSFLNFCRKVLFWSLQASSMFIFTLLRVSGKDLKS